MGDPYLDISDLFEKWLSFIFFIFFYLLHGNEDPATSNRRCTALDTLLTCCPPGPRARMGASSTSAKEITWCISGQAPGRKSGNGWFGGPQHACCRYGRFVLAQLARVLVVFVRAGRWRSCLLIWGNQMPSRTMPHPYFARGFRCESIAARLGASASVRDGVGAG